MYYSYDNLTKKYIGEVVGQPSPLEEGVIFQPSFSTLVEPDFTALETGEVLVFSTDEERWNAVYDFSGEAVFLKSDASQVILNIGEPMTDDHTFLDPRQLEFPLWSTDVWIEDDIKVEAKKLKDEEAEAKETKQTALANITVTTTNGNTFDGDDIARSDMMSAITSADTLGMTETSWKLSDNSWATVDIAEMREALALSIQAKGVILNG